MGWFFRNLSEDRSQRQFFFKGEEKKKKERENGFSDEGIKFYISELQKRRKV